MIFRLDLDAFLGLYRLVETVRPAATGHEPTCELVDDDYLAVLHHVVHILLEEGVGLQGLADVVKHVHLGRVVEVFHVEQPLAMGNPLLGQGDGTGLFVHDVVARRLGLDLGQLAFDDGGRALELGNDPIDLVVPIGRAFGGAGDDERRPRLVDEDRVDLVHDGVVMLALNHLLQVEPHVVPEVVEAELVVRAVRDVGVIRLAPGARPEPGEPDVGGDVGGVVEIGDLVLDDAQAQAQGVVDRPHPLRVASGQIVVDGDDVGAEPGQAIQVGGKRGHEGLALARCHLRDLPLMEDHTPHELHVEVAHANGAPGRLAADGEGLDEQIVQLGAVGQPLPELVGLRLELGVRQALERGLLDIDGFDEGPHALRVALVLGAEDRANEDVQHDLYLTLVGRTGTFEELTRVPARRIGDLLTTEHARHLVHPGRGFEGGHRGPCRALDHALVHDEVMLGERGNRRQMRHTEDLPPGRGLPELLPYRVGHTSTDTRIHLVEDHGRHVFRRGENGLDGQHGSRELAARDDLGQRLQILSGIGGEQELDGLCPPGPNAPAAGSTGQIALARELAAQGSAEARVLHAEGAELALKQALELSRSFRPRF